MFAYCGVDNRVEIGAAIAATAAVTRTARARTLRTLGSANSEFVCFCERVGQIARLTTFDQGAHRMAHRLEPLYADRFGEGLDMTLQLQFATPGNRLG